MARLTQVAIGAADLAAAARFYSEVLGAEPLATYDPPGLVFFDLGGTRLLLDRNVTGGIVYLGVDDVEAALQKAVDAGATTEGEPHVIFRHEDDTLGPAGTDEWHAFFRDPDGNLVGLIEQRPVSG